MSAPAAPEISVVVPVHGDRGGLARTLACLEAQETARSFEVVVVDNGDNGDDRLASVLVAHRRARVVVETRPGSYRARNAGVLAAGGTVLAFTDADCLPEPQWLEQGARALEDAGPNAFVGGRVQVVVEGARAPSTAELWQLGYDLRQETYVRERGWAVTANLFVRRADFERAGPFATGLESGGDREWGERATARGMRAVYSPTASLRHPARPTMAQLNAKIRRITRGAAARQRSGGAVVHPDGWWRSARPILRSSWQRSASLSPDLTTRARFVAVALWVHYYRLVHGLLLLHGADGHRRAAETSSSSAA